MQLKQRQEKISKVNKSRTKLNLEFSRPYFWFNVFAFAGFPNHILRSIACDQLYNAGAKSLLIYYIYYIVVCETFYESFSSKSKAINVFPKHTLKSKTGDQSQLARQKSFCHVIIKNYLCNVLCKIYINIESTWRREIKEQTLLLTLLYSGRTVAWKSAVMSEIYIDISNFLNICYYKTQV